MASNLHTEIRADGLRHTFQRRKQGRHNSPAEIKAQRVNIILTPQARRLGAKLAQERGITFSALIADLLYTPELLNT